MASDFGYGFMDPTDSTSELGKIAFAVRQMMARMRTTVPVQVMAVHSPGGVGPAGTVDVMPLVNMVDGKGNAVPHGTIFGVPYFRLQGGSTAVILDPAAGDRGFIVVADRDISSVKANQQQANPGSGRKHDLADGIYVGGILNGAPTQYLSFTADGAMLVDVNGNSVAMTKSGMTLTDATGNKVAIDSAGITLKSQSVTIEGDLIVNGAIGSGTTGPDSVTLQFHTHAGNGLPPTPGT